MSEEQHPPEEEEEARLRVFPELAREFAAAEDGFERLWTPHRMAYIRGERPSAEAGEGCPFCLAPQRADDAEGLIVHRGEHCYVVMNLFPYNPGHVLVCPYRHVALYIDLTDEETSEFTALTRAAIVALTNASAPMGFNIGMNQGAVAGAGVRRTCTSTSSRGGVATRTSCPVVAQTKALPMLLEDVRQQLVAAWPR